MDAKKAYIVPVLIFVGSMTAMVLVPAGTLRKLAVPGIGALFLAMFAAMLQILRDSVTHQRSLSVLDAQNSFSIGATSHMADVAFDKYSLFCEEYVAEMFKALETLGREGPSQAARTHAFTLLEIRRRSAVWLTPEVETELDRFEDAIRKIGNDAWLVAQVPGEPAAIKRMFHLFAEVIGLEHWDGKQITGELTVLSVIGKLQQVLGTDELSRMRSKLVKRALQNIQSPEE